MNTEAAPEEKQSAAARLADTRMVSSDPEMVGSLINAEAKSSGDYFFNERRLQTATSLSYNEAERRRACSVIGGLQVEKDSGGFTISGFFFSKYFSIIISIMGFLFLLIGLVLTWTCFSMEEKGSGLTIQRTEMPEENKIIGPVCMLIGICMLFMGSFFGFISWKVYKCDAHRQTDYVFGNTEVIVCGLETPHDSSIQLMSIKDNEMEMEPIKYFDKGLNVTDVGGFSESPGRRNRPSSTIGDRNELSNSLRRNHSLPLIKGLRGVNGAKVGVEGSSWFPEEKQQNRNDLFSNLRWRGSAVLTNKCEENFFDSNEPTTHEARRRSDIACFPKKEHTGEFFDNYFLDGDECPQEVEEQPTLKEESNSPTQEVGTFIDDLDECSFGTADSSFSNSSSKKDISSNTKNVVVTHEEATDVIESIESE